MKIFTTPLATRRVTTLRGTSSERYLDRILDVIDTAVDITAMIATHRGTVEAAKTESETVYVMRSGLVRTILIYRPANADEIILASVYLAGADVVQQLHEAVPVSTPVTRWRRPKRRRLVADDAS